MTGDFTGNAGDRQTDVVTVTGVEPTTNRPVTDTDDATVVLTNVAPVIDVVVDATPPSRPEPGGSFTFSGSPTRAPSGSRSRRSPTDVYGNLNGRGTCRTGAVLQPFPGPGNV